jgi:hypothetical protein
MTENNIQAGAMAYRPGRVMRAYLALGFRYSAHAPRPDDDEARYTIHRTTTYWDWADRFRILISGKTELEICVETETLETVKGIQSRAVVLAPDAIVRRSL